MTAERIEFLRNRLLERDVLVEDVWEYLELNHQPMTGQIMQPLGNFIDTPHLANFWWLVDWWAPVQNKPLNLATPTIQGFCFHVNYLPGTEPTTFDMATRGFYQRALAWCAENNIDSQNTTESKEDRAKRINAERMREARGHRRVPDKKLKHDDILAANVRDLESQRELIKLEAKAVEDELSAQVKAHQDKMIERAAYRKFKKAEYKERIDAINLQIRNMTQK